VTSSQDGHPDRTASPPLLGREGLRRGRRGEVEEAPCAPVATSMDMNAITRSQLRLCSVSSERAGGVRALSEVALRSQQTAVGTVLPALGNY
jgi:hypothetical protein